MEKEKLEEILAEHRVWLESNGDKGKRADLTGAVLRGVYLNGAVLRGADLRETNLSSTHLRRADLRRTNLKGANLCNADLRDADLYGATLRNTDLCRANLQDANLRSADLRGTRVKILDLSRHRLIKYPTDLAIGCERYSLKYWLENIEDIGKKYRYSDAEIDEYRAAINFAAELFKQEVAISKTG